MYNVLKEIGILIVALIMTFFVFALILPGSASDEAREVLHVLYRNLPQFLGFGAFLLIKTTRLNKYHLFSKYNISPFLLSFGLFGVLGSTISLLCDRVFFMEYCGWTCKQPIWSIKYVRYALTLRGQIFWMTLICQILNLVLKEDKFKKLALSCGNVFCIIAILLFFPISAFLSR